jgi:hypothetical protein
MSFWGKLGGALKGIGKFALKAAPVASAFIPGVGPLASIGIGAASGALSKKFDGGGWDDMLKGGLIGGATGAAAGYGKGLLGKLGGKFNEMNAASRVGEVGRMVKGPSTLQKGLGIMGMMNNRSGGIGPSNMPRGFDNPYQRGWMSPYMRSPYGNRISSFGRGSNSRSGMRLPNEQRSRMSPMMGNYRFGGGFADPRQMGQNMPFIKGAMY